MSGPHTITRRHLDRLAIVYVRQSTFIQVRDHTESTRRQYAQSQDAAQLGWPASQIVTIDADLGLSGRSATGRAGFKELVSRVCVGEVGAIFGLEISRLARSSADLQRLLEFCSLTETLIVDADGIYDLQNFNDRLLLGLKGTMSEAELHLLAGRLQESKRAAAQRGALRCPLPVGYRYDDDGHTIMDAHEEIRAAVAELFAAFGITGSPGATVGTATWKWPRGLAKHGFLVQHATDVANVATYSPQLACTKTRYTLGGLVPSGSSVCLRVAAVDPHAATAQSPWSVWVSGTNGPSPVPMKTRPSGSTATPRRPHIPPPSGEKILAFFVARSKERKALVRPPHACALDA